jgi:hypothetical protein
MTQNETLRPLQVKGADGKIEGYICPVCYQNAPTEAAILECLKQHATVLYD